jgi:FkbM family methyltransferase
MINFSFEFISQFPNFKGKLTLADKIYHLKPEAISTNKIGKMNPGHKMLLNINDRIQRRMFVKKSHEPETEIHLKNFLATSKSFLDIGANVGYFTLMAKATNPQIKVFSFEPNPNNVRKIEENINLNQFQDITLSSSCVSDMAGEVSFSVPPVNESGWGRITNDHLPLDNFTHITTKSITIDQLINENYFGKHIPDLVKIDVEGNEFKILKGAKDFLKNHSAILCIELNEPCLLDCGSSSDEIIGYLKDFGYKCFAIKENDQLVEAHFNEPQYKYLNYFFMK